MLSLIEVKCPHCGAQGQIMMPPLGAIIVGPCPQCEEMVVVFCGAVLALEKEVLVNGSPIEKREHLLEVLNTFLQDRVERLFTNSETAEAEQDDVAALEAELQQDEVAQEAPAPTRQRTPKRPGITDNEFEAFIQTDLKLIDNAAYFRAMFS